MKYVYDDGGRAAAGYKGVTGDCACRAITIATGLPYQQVYDDINELGAAERMSKHRRRRGKSSARNGIWKPTMKRYMNRLGWTWTPTMFIGSGCKVHLREGELPMGNLIVACSRHLVAVVDGVVHDIYDPTRDATRCVYGYWSKKWT